MALKQQIQNDVKEAMKQKNQEMVDILRMAVASINAKQTEKRYKLAKDNPGKAEEELIKESELSDDEIIGVLTSEIKKRRDAIALYGQGNRPELADKERKEIEILQKYLPEQLGPAELKKMVEESVKNVGAKELLSG